MFDRNETLQLVLSDNTIPYKGGIAPEELNGPVTIELEVLADNPEVSKIENEGRLVTRDSDGELKEFIIRNIEDSYDDNGARKIIEGEGGEYDLIDDFLPGYSEPSVFIQDALSAVLQGTRWSVGHVDAFKQQRSIDLKNVSVRKAVTEIINKFDGEVKYRIETKGKRITGRYVDVYTKRGSLRSSHRFEEGVDLISSSRELDSAPIKTALFGRGKADADGNRLTFADVEWRKDKGDPIDKPKGQTYVGDLVAMRNWGRKGGRQHKYGFYDGDEEDPAELLLNTWRELQEKVNLNKTYETDVLNLGKLLGVPYYDVKLGDEVEVVNRSVYPNIVTTATVIEYVHNLNDKSKSEITLGHFRNALDLDRRINNVEKEWNEKKGELEKKPEKVKEEVKKDMDNSFKEQHDYIDKQMKKNKDRIEQAKKDLKDAMDKIEVGKEDVRGLNDSLDQLDKAVSNKIPFGMAANDVNKYNTKILGKNLVVNGDTTITGTIAAPHAVIKDFEARDITAKNATIESGVFTGDFVSPNATIKKATFEDVVISGELNGVTGTFNGDVTGGRIMSKHVTFVGSDLKVTDNLYLGDGGVLSQNKKLVFNDLAYMRSVDGNLEMYTTSFRLKSIGSGTLEFGGVSGSKSSTNYSGIKFTTASIFQDLSDKNRLKLNAGNMQLWIDPTNDNVYILKNGVLKHVFYGTGDHSHAGTETNDLK